MQLAITGALDISQHFYFLQNWAVKVTMGNHAYSETFYSAHAGNSLRSRINYANSFFLGVTYSCTANPDEFSFRNCF